MVKGNNPTTRSFKRAVIRGTRFIKKQSSKLNQRTEQVPRKRDPKEIVVAVDAMGGDYAPQEIVKGSIRAAREFNIQVQLVGPPDRISRELSKYDIHDLPIEIVPANDFITMEDKQPATTVRRKPESSIVVSMRQVVSGQADAVVSAGSTGAAAAAGLFCLKRIPGIERPGIAVVVPTAEGNLVLVDAGANVDSTPYQIAQHSIMGSLFAANLMDIEQPRVGLLNIGEEPGKGNQVTKEVFAILEKMQSINFVGNVEGRTLAEQFCEVLVADGFVGNVFLKTLEGSIKMAFHMLHQELTSSMDLKMGAMICKPAFKALKQERLNYAKYGGAVLLGIQGVVVIAHGISNDFAIMNAIKLAADTARSKIIDRIKENLEVDDIKALSKEISLQNSSKTKVNNDSAEGNE
ncbi:MAG: phosphate acyltransferase PlsX [Candidatus Caenarcaniphilales bacterium]|nr:phosphate acyltransferase PlsX [Candidatus Caenarcaniphilales bacterium]